MQIFNVLYNIPSNNTSMKMTHNRWQKHVGGCGIYDIRNKSTYLYVHLLVNSHK